MEKTTSEVSKKLDHHYPRLVTSTDVLASHFAFIRKQPKRGKRYQLQTKRRRLPMLVRSDEAKPVRVYTIHEASTRAFVHTCCIQQSNATAR